MYTKVILDCTTTDEAKDGIFKATLTCNSQLKVKANTVLYFD